MTILNDMGVSKLSGNVYSGSELTFKVNWEHDLLIMFVEWYVNSILHPLYEIEDRSC